MMESDAAFLRASTSKLNTPLTAESLDLPAPRDSDDYGPLPPAVLDSALATLSNSLAAARKAKLASSVAASVVEQVLACREERVGLRKRRDAAIRSKGKMRIPATVETWWEDLPEEWAEDPEADEEDVDVEAAEQYADALQRLKTLQARRAKLRQQVARYEHVSSLMTSVNADKLATKLSPTRPSDLVARIARTRRKVEASRSELAKKRKRLEAQEPTSASTAVHVLLR